MTRRDLCSAALASRFLAPDPIEDRLGIFCLLGTSEASTRPSLAAARCGLPPRPDSIPLAARR